ncbi:hypothetical protein AURDEDRAFT_152509 [Auricularia subglabra TFB-10046 SS5]|nr:hypothetical protein AURDEDRAFT_152509 [Auricularia subglabra TFB-10046 SS5]
MKFYTSLCALLAVSGAVLAQGSQLVPGTYRITAATAPGSALTAPTSKNQPLVVSPVNNGTNQLWTLTAVPGLGAGNFTFKNVGTGDAMFAPGFPVIGTTIVGSQSDTSNWFTRPDGNAWRIFININLAVTFHDTSVTGVSLRSTTSITGDTQAWNFELIGPVIPGTYKVSNPASNTFWDNCLCSAGTAVPLVSIASSSSASQKWIVSSAGNGGYTIRNAATNAFLLAPGTPVIGTTVVSDPTASVFVWTFNKQPSGLFTIQTTDLAINLVLPNAHGAVVDTVLFTTPTPGAMLWDFIPA